MDKLLALPEISQILVLIFWEPFSVNHWSHPSDKVILILCGVFFPVDYVIFKRSKTIFLLKVVLSIWRWELKVFQRIFPHVLFLHVNCVKRAFV